MSSANATLDTSSKSASKKKKKGKKKTNGTTTPNSAVADANGSRHDDVEGEEDEDALSRSQSPTKELVTPQLAGEDSIQMPSSLLPDADNPADGDLPVRNGTQQPANTDKAHDEPQVDGEGEEEEDTDTIAAQVDHKESIATSGTTARLDAMQQERDSLRAEVSKLRESLEKLQQNHDDELSGVRQELEESQQGREHAETQYKNLLGKVNTIRSQLGERLKADAAELETARERIEELESSNRKGHEENERLQERISKLNTDIASQASEVESLRSRTNLSTSNWAKERDDLLSKEAYMREEYEVAKQAMQDWEILATEERSRRETLEEKAQELEDQLSAQREAYERVRNENDTQSSTVDGLQRALRDVQDERKRELREMVEQNQTQLEALKSQTKIAQDTAEGLQKQLNETKKELERTLPFEKEVKEKNLLIGKLRHEAVTLNDHLTKALRFLKRGKPEDNVDRQLVTNHFLHFIQLDRSDPKKFQILQLISALLGWDEPQKEQAGLLRQGTSFANAGGSLRVPISPFRRTPSTPSLGDFTPESPLGGRERESLAELWSDFLEREAQQGGGGSSGSVSGHSRRSSVASRSGYNNLRSPSMGGLMSPTSETGRPGPFGGGLKRKESSGPGGGKPESPGPGVPKTESPGPAK